MDDGVNDGKVFGIAKNAEIWLKRWTEDDLKLNEGDIFIRMYSAVLDVKDFCRIQDEQQWKEAGQIRLKKVYEGHGAPARQTTRPDLLRLTRRALLAAELLPWLVKG
ncbi:hypothetical protein B0F90DRAFT_1670381 [Multifurca ochricompacta]|uniref:Uncharacterized protein n=1 Tax=Multifurca ochricompacta TaxID=376703 RepID=A0AAD4LXR1_9AGAM|nr:hypothetical protein B0F90DRAFT_1670381 [Multifurca ochricompacta]